MVYQINGNPTASLTAYAGLRQRPYRSFAFLTGGLVLAKDRERRKKCHCVTSPWQRHPNIIRASKLYQIVWCDFLPNAKQIPLCVLLQTTEITYIAGHVLLHAYLTICSNSDSLFRKICYELIASHYASMMVLAPDRLGHDLGLLHLPHPYGRSMRCFISILQII